MHAADEAVPGAEPAECPHPHSTARIEHIHIAGAAGAPMQRIEAGVAVRGAGLEGDRYRVRGGFWQDARVSRDLTLIEAEAVEDLAATLQRSIEAGETRRNVTTRGIRLNDLVGRIFWIGSVLARGTGLCEPCEHLVSLTGKPILRPLVHRGGLRADLLSSGLVQVGDRIRPAEPEEGVGVIVTRGDRVLIGPRRARHGYGAWSFPGGKPSVGESVEDCAIRELREESGLVGTEPRVVMQTIDGFPKSRTVFRTTFVRLTAVAGIPRVLEPHKVARWEWRPWGMLPEPLFEPVGSLLSAGYDPMLD